MQLPTVYISQDGRETPIEKMVDNHLNNAIKSFKKNHAAFLEKLTLDYACIDPEKRTPIMEKQMEMAERPIEENPLFIALAEEAKRRNLKTP